MAKQEMTFRLAYVGVECKTTCKSCHNVADPGSLLVGAKTAAMFDPMWYHHTCFWTRCPYRKQMSRHYDKYTELDGYSELTKEDRLRFKRALDSMKTGAVVTPGDDDGGGSASGEPEEREVDDARDTKGVRPVCQDVGPGRVLDIPKLSMSATERLSRSPSPASVQGNDKMGDKD